MVSCAATSSSESDEATDHLSKDNDGCASICAKSIASSCSVFSFRISAVSSGCSDPGEPTGNLVVADSVGLIDCSWTLSGFCTLAPSVAEEIFGEVFPVASPEGDTLP